MTVLKSVTYQQYLEEVQLPEREESVLLFQEQKMREAVEKNIFLQICLCQYMEEFLRYRNIQNRQSVYYFTEKEGEAEQTAVLSFFFRELNLYRDKEGRVLYACVSELNERTLHLFFDLLGQRKIHERVLEYFYHDKVAMYNTEEYKQRGFSTIPYRCFLFEPEIEAAHFDFSEFFIQEFTQMCLWKAEVFVMVVTKKDFLRYAETDVLLNFLSAHWEKVYIENQSNERKNIFSYHIICAGKAREKIDDTPLIMCG